jgi:glutamate-ammonia-ligase adenylyltransferase
LVLSNAAHHGQLTADIGNIALLKLCGTLDLIQPTLANSVADAYRTFRKMQHHIRMQGEERARVEPQRVKQEATAVKQLWHAVFG